MPNLELKSIANRSKEWNRPKWLDFRLTSIVNCGENIAFLLYPFAQVYVRLAYLFFGFCELVTNISGTDPVSQGQWSWTCKHLAFQVYVSSAFFNYISGGAIAPPGKEFAPPSKAISAPEVRSRIAHDCCQNCSWFTW
jgi:hypothetical protein